MYFQRQVARDAGSFSCGDSLDKNMVGMMG